GRDDLYGVILLFTRRGPVVDAHLGERFATGLSLLVDVGDAALLAEGGIGQHHAEALARVGGQAVADVDRAGLRVRPDAVQVQVHDAEAGGVVDDLPAAQGVVRDVVELVAVERVVVAEDVVVGGQEEAAGPGGRVTDRVCRR